MPRPLLLGNLLVLDIPVWSHPYCLPGLITSLCLTFQFDHSRVLDIPVWSHSCAWHPSLIASYRAICWIHTTESCSTGSAKEKTWFGERLRKYFFLAKMSISGYKNFWYNDTVFGSFGSTESSNEFSKNHLFPVECLPALVVICDPSNGGKYSNAFELSTTYTPVYAFI